VQHGDAGAQAARRLYAVGQYGLNAPASACMGAALQGSPAGHKPLKGKVGLFCQQPCRGVTIYEKGIFKQRAYQGQLQQLMHCGCKVLRVKGLCGMPGRLALAAVMVGKNLFHCSKKRAQLFTGPRGFCLPLIPWFVFLMVDAMKKLFICGLFCPAGESVPRLEESVAGLRSKTAGEAILPAAAGYAVIHGSNFITLLTAAAGFLPRAAAFCAERLLQPGDKTFKLVYCCDLLCLSSKSACSPCRHGKTSGSIGKGGAAAGSFVALSCGLSLPGTGSTL